MELPHRLSSREKASIIYHSLFDYRLSKKELARWAAGPRVKIKPSKLALVKGTINKDYSMAKNKIAGRAALILGKIPTVKAVAITGSLAMNNSSKNSDIDLMIVTKTGTLWTTRLISYLMLFINNFELRKAGDKNEKDKLCLNMWLDESDLSIKKRNIFTAHEIAQIVPIINKDQTYERLLWVNKWILDYWPKAVKIKKIGSISRRDSPMLVEKLAFWIQYLYMKPKITREVVSPTRAFFHPSDGSAYVKKKLRDITV